MRGGAAVGKTGSYLAAPKDLAGGRASSNE